MNHAKGGNAEDCPGCEGTNPPYPFICPGDDRYADQREHGIACAHVHTYLSPNCPGAPVDAATVNARRGRYAEALRPGSAGPDGTYPEGLLRDADAAIAVADEEMDSVHRALDEERDVAVQKEAENERLRAEVEQQKKLRAIAEGRHLTASERADTAYAENARLREEIARLRDELRAQHAGEGQ